MSETDPRLLTGEVKVFYGGGRRLRFPLTRRRFRRFLGQEYWIRGARPGEIITLGAIDGYANFNICDQRPPLMTEQQVTPPPATYVVSETPQTPPGSCCRHCCCDAR